MIPQLAGPLLPSLFGALVAVGLFLIEPVPVTI